MIIFFLLLLHLLLSYLVQFTAWPEMIAYPYLMNNGFKLYGDIVHPYLPLLPYILLGSFKLLGFQIETLRIITLIFLLLSDYLIFLTVRKKYSLSGAYFSVIFFIVLSLFFEGNGLWFDLASVPFIMSAFYLTVCNKITHKSILLSGLLVSAAILIKQTNAIFIVPIVFTLWKDKKYVLPFLFAVGFPLATVGIFYSFTDQSQSFWYWAIYHPLFVHGHMPGFMLLPTKGQFLGSLLIFSPTLLLFIKSKTLIVWICISFLFAIPRFAYFHLLHAAAFLAVSLPAISSKENKKYLWPYILCIMLLMSNYLANNFGKPVRFFEADVGKQRLSLAAGIPKDTSVYFYNVPANYWIGLSVLPTKPWADLFPWYLEIPQMQEKVIEGISKSDFVIYKPINSGDRFALGSYVPEKIDAYIKEHFMQEKNNTEEIYLLRRTK